MTRRRRTWRRRARRPVILPLVFVLLAVAAFVEFAADGVRLVVRLRPQQTAGIAARWDADDYLRWRFQPGQERVQVNQRAVRINQYGLRGPELQSRSRRVVCLGDSTTFGWTASDDTRTYPALLGSLLDDLDAEVVNAGMPRWNTVDLLDFYVVRLVPLQADVVILMMGWNDLGYQWARAAAPAAHPRLSMAMDVLSSAWLAKQCRTLWQRAFDGWRVADALQTQVSRRDPIRWESMEEFAQALRALVVLARADGSTPVLVTLPHFLDGPVMPEMQHKLVTHFLAWPQLSHAGWARMISAANEHIRRVAREYDVPLADCEHSIAAEHFVDLGHVDDTGHALLAACVAPPVREALRARPRATARRTP